MPPTEHSRTLETQILDTINSRLKNLPPDQYAVTLENLIELLEARLSEATLQRNFYSCCNRVLNQPH